MGKQHHPTDNRVRTVHASRRLLPKTSHLAPASASEEQQQEEQELEGTRILAMARLPPTYSISILGDGAVGKTALAVQFVNNHFIETFNPTIEDSYRKQLSIDGDVCVVELLDTAGQEEYTALRDQWIRAGQAYLLVYSTVSRSSFESIPKIWEAIRRVREEQWVPVILVGNKADMVREREVSKEEGQLMARRLGCGFWETSAKTAVGVDGAFFDVVRLIKKGARMQEKIVLQVEKGGCCTIL